MEQSLLGSNVRSRRPAQHRRRRPRRRHRRGAAGGRRPRRGQLVRHAVEREPPHAQHRRLDPRRSTTCCLQKAKGHASPTPEALKSICKRRRLNYCPPAQRLVADAGLCPVLAVRQKNSSPSTARRRRTATSRSVVLPDEAAPTHSSFLVPLNRIFKYFWAFLVSVAYKVRNVSMPVVRVNARRFPALAFSLISGEFAQKFVRSPPFLNPLLDGPFGTFSCQQCASFRIFGSSMSGQLLMLV